ncbi:MAG: DUF3313 domain-containing protein, partial [Methylococcaceae bacterium]|nr:DUF3313 domain-containing protein [Methylococcaceae bacterium]
LLPVLGLLFCLCAGLLSGCSVQNEANELKSMVVEPAPDAGFIENPELQSKRADLPFQKVWVKPNFDASHYKELVVPPVNTQYMLEMDWLHQLSSANLLGSIKKDIEELGVYFHDQVVTEFKEDPNHRFQIIQYVSEHRQPALRLELALIEINPSQPALHAAGWLTLGGGTAAGVVNQRRAAFEGRLRDLQTGEVVATFADRDMQDAGPLDLTRLTWYGPAKSIMDRWAKQFVEIANKKPGEVVSDPTPLTLKPF